MKIAIIGYGRMGHEIEKMAIEKGHEVTLIIDYYSENFTSEKLSMVDVAIEFTTPETAFDNIKRCLEANVPVVSGTTGWNGYGEEVKDLVRSTNGTLFYASNFSIGVNLFFYINRILAKKLSESGGYSVDIEETHHLKKKDAPSGTAISLANYISNEMSELSGWTLLPERQDYKIPIKAIREGDVPGTHSVQYSSIQDDIVLTHKAKSRRGFAEGAVLAAEFAIGKKGFLTMDSFLGLE